MTLVRAHLTMSLDGFLAESGAGNGAFVVGPVGGPGDVAAVIVTHAPPTVRPDEGVTISFVIDGIEEAMAAAKRLAGEGHTVSLAGPMAAKACLDAGLLDEIGIALVPVVLGRGVPFLTGATGPIRLEDPEVTEAAGVTHLRYRVRPSAA